MVMFNRKRLLSAGAVVVTLTIVMISAKYGKVDAGNTEEGKVEVYSGVLAKQNKEDTPLQEDLYYPEGISEDTLEDLFDKKHISTDIELEPEDIYEVGENIIITQNDLDQYETFYELEGSSDADVQKLAATYAEQQAALYAEAIKAGFSVTDQEVSEYLADLKENLETENKELYEHALEGFDSEEDYWDFENKVYQVDLPIQKYVKSLEEQFRQESGLEQGTEEWEQAWSERFETIKKELVEKQDFRDLKEVL